MKPLILPKRVSQQHIQVEYQASPIGLEGALVFLFTVVIVAPA